MARTEFPTAAPWVPVTTSVRTLRAAAQGCRGCDLYKRATQAVFGAGPWLDAEMQAVTPHVIVCLGASAAQSLLGPSFRLMRTRGRLVAGPGGERVVATIHPSAVLRAPDAGRRREAYASLVADLKVVARLLRHPSRGTR